MKLYMLVKRVMNMARKAATCPELLCGRRRLVEIRRAVPLLLPRAVHFSFHMEHLEDFFDIQGGAPASVADILASRDPDRVVGERAQAGDDVGVLANARSVLGESCVAHVVAAVLDPPVTPDPFVPALGRLAESRGN